MAPPGCCNFLSSTYALAFVSGLGWPTWRIWDTLVPSTPSGINSPHLFLIPNPDHGTHNPAEWIPRDSIYLDQQLKENWSYLVILKTMEMDLPTRLTTGSGVTR